MIDLRNVEKYRENNRIEAKKALGGLPESIWETYSAFANTLGGVILLGVEEYKDKSFHVLDLPDPEGMIEKFKKILNDKHKVSTNILSDRDISIEKYKGKRFIAINIPKADRFDKPVYIDGNITSGTYRRGGEGDYKCKKEEIESMKRDSERISADSAICYDLTFSDLSIGTLRKFKEKVSLVRDVSDMSEKDLLMSVMEFQSHKAGTVPINIAALLMFGKKDKIKEYYPFFAPSFTENDGETSVKFEAENLFELYLISEKVIMKKLCAFCMKAKEKKTVFDAVSEAIANAMIHSDYLSKISIEIEYSEDRLSVSNAGSLRFEKEAVICGGITDRRNELIARLLSFAAIGSDGVKGIYKVWKNKGWQPPKVIERFSPDTVTVVLNFYGGEAELSGTDALIESRKEAVIDYITEKIAVTSSDIASLLGIKSEKALEILRALTFEEILTFEKKGTKFYFRLKS